MKRGRLCTVFLVFVVITFSLKTSLRAQENPCSDWAKAVLHELGCMAIASGPIHGECVARGMFEQNTIVSDFGFTTKNPPYSIEVTSLDFDRYNIILQAMTTMHDRQEKIVHFKSDAVSKLPVKSAPVVPEGKIEYTLTMNYDLKDQLGIASSHEVFGTTRGFIDLVVLEPKKLQDKGYPLFKRMDTRLQLVYLGENSWKIHSREGDVGPILVYENTKWTTTDVSPVKKTGAEAQPAQEEGLSESPAIEYVNKKVRFFSEDLVKEENVIGPAIMLTLSSHAPMVDIITYYEKALQTKGWSTNKKFVQNEQGVLVMGKGKERFMISTSNSQKLQGNANSLYMVTLTPYKQ